ncbi:MAG: hypothetical protein D6761_09645 [Candidatus Dadabacteria bacterium]|nr:MAG: hypothetical protein D6761_09645 [Candidatus Dadabacteria bacterium]
MTPGVSRLSVAALKYAPMIPGRIHGVGFGWINLGGSIFEHDRIVHPDGVSPVWWRRSRHDFVLEDALEILAAYPIRVLIVGTGWMGMLRVADEEISAALAERGVGFEVMRTPDAASRWQRTFAEGIPCAAALHLTC